MCIECSDFGKPDDQKSEKNHNWEIVDTNVNLLMMLVNI